MRNTDGTERSIRVIFSDPIKYLIGSCGRETRFPVDLPTEQKKLWTFTRTSKGVKYECNGLEVLDLELSDVTCKVWGPTWREAWEKDIVGIQFLAEDNASEFYLPKTGKHNKYRFCDCIH